MSPRITSMSSPYSTNPYIARASILLRFDAMVPLSFGKSTKKMFCFNKTNKKENLEKEHNRLWSERF